MADGILATTELIYGRALAAQRREAFDPRPPAAEVSGAGAQTAARLGQDYDMGPLRQRSERVDAGVSSLATVEAYLAAMKARNACSELPIYSAERQKMLADWTVTRAQMDNLSRPAPRICSSSSSRVATSAAAS